MLPILYCDDWPTCTLCWDGGGGGGDTSRGYTQCHPVISPSPVC